MKNTDYYVTTTNTTNDGLPAMGLSLTWNRDEDCPREADFIPVKVTFGETFHAAGLSQYVRELAALMNARPIRIDNGHVLAELVAEFGDDETAGLFSTLDRTRI
jgi:hypothetical protein